MKKITTFVIDDVIWLFRDLTRQKPASLFDNPFIKMLKEAHDKYGLKVQLNIFYKTDNFYGNDEFSLEEMTDVYKEEWKKASDWLKFGFHSLCEFPDYPYINADYDHVKEDFTKMQREVYRFASPENWACAVLNHWRPMSKDGCRALYDCGVKLISATTGERFEYTGDDSTLPYGHSFRLLHNRKPETMVFKRPGRNAAIANSLCGYNHVDGDEFEITHNTSKFIIDKEIGIKFKNFADGPVHNLCTLDNMGSDMESFIGKEYIGWGSHEQYFYADYFNYQPDYAKKLMVACEVLKENGYEFIFMQDLIK